MSPSHLNQLHNVIHWEGREGEEGEEGGEGGEGGREWREGQDLSYTDRSQVFHQIHLSSPCPHHMYTSCRYTDRYHTVSATRNSSQTLCSTLRCSVSNETITQTHARLVDEG